MLLHTQKISEKCTDHCCCPACPNMLQHSSSIRLFTDSLVSRMPHPMVKNCLETLANIPGAVTSSDCHLISYTYFHHNYSRLCYLCAVSEQLDNNCI